MGIEEDEKNEIGERDEDQKKMCNKDNLESMIRGINSFKRFF